MDIKEGLICPKCSDNDFSIEREVTYVYTYKVDLKNAEDKIDVAEKLPFLFDNREKSNSIEYVKCDNCGEKFPINLEDYKKHIDMTILRKAIRADHVESPEFLG